MVTTWCLYFRASAPRNDTQVKQVQLMAGSHRHHLRSPSAAPAGPRPSRPSPPPPPSRAAAGLRGSAARSPACAGLPCASSSASPPGSRRGSAARHRRRVGSATATRRAHPPAGLAPARLPTWACGRSGGAACAGRPCRGGGDLVKLSLQMVDLRL